MDLVTIKENLPDNVKAEMLDGMLYVQAAPSAAHQHVVKVITSGLYSSYESSGTWIFLNDTELTIPRHVYHDTSPDIVPRQNSFQPDIAGWRIGIPGAPNSVDNIDFSNYMPAWVCEVQSTNRAYDWDIKKPIYAAIGVPFLWMVDPKTQTIHAFELLRGVYVAIDSYIGKPADRIPNLKPFLDYTIDFERVWRLGQVST